MSRSKPKIKKPLNRAFALFFAVIVLAGLVSVVLISGCIPRESTPTPAPAQITKQGILTQDETWSGDILVTRSGLTVAEGVTLTIEPGTTVRFEHTKPTPGANLLIKGVLMAVGTADKPIRFTSDAPQPEHGDWLGINLNPGSARSVMDHCIVEYGSAAVHVEDNVTISNSILRWTTGCALPLFSTCTVTRNRIYQAGDSSIEVHYRTEPTITYNTLWGSGCGIRVEAHSHPVIHHNIIRNNRLDGIDITWSSSATVEYNFITGNGGVGIAVGQRGSASESIVRYNNIYNNQIADVMDSNEGVSETLTVTNNWWGATDETAIEAKMSYAPGITIVYKPYLTSAVDIGELTYDFEDNETYAHLAKTENDTYEYIFTENDNTRTIVASLTPPAGAGGIAWDGEFLYVASELICKLDLSGNVIGSFPSPAVQNMGLAFDGQNLWVLDHTEKKVFQVDRSGEVIKSIPAPCDEPLGLTYDGTYLWTFSGQVQGKAYQFDTSGNVVRTLQTSGLSGLAWDGEYIWVNSVPEIQQIDPSDGHVVRAITSSGVCTQYLTWQEPYLWACEWGNQTPEGERLVKMLPSEEI